MSDADLPNSAPQPKASAPTRRAGLLSTHPALLACSVLGVLAFVMRFHHLGLQSLWLDEGYTWERAAMVLPDTIKATIARHHVPTYFVFMHYFITLGDSELMLRLPSAFFGALAVSATCALGYVVGGARAGIVAGCFQLLSPLQVRYSQEARMYSTIVFFATCALAALCWLGDHPQHASRPILGTRALWSRRQRSQQLEHVDRATTIAWTVYVVGVTACLYLHNTCIVVGSTMTLAAAPWLFGKRFASGDERPRFIANFVLANLVVLAIWGLYLGTLIGQAQKLSHNFWETYPTPRAIFEVACSMFFFESHSTLVIALWLSLAAAGVYALRGRRQLGISLIVGSFAPAITFLLISLHTPMFLPRILLWSAPPFFALCACAARIPKRAAWSVAVVGCAAALAAIPLHTLLETEYKSPWRGAAQLVQSTAASGERVVGPQRQPGVLMSYYFRDSDHRVEELSLKQFTKRVRRDPHVWIVDTQRKGKSPAYVAALVPPGKVGFRQLVGKKILVIRVDQPQASGQPPSR